MCQAVLGCKFRWRAVLLCWCRLCEFFVQICKEVPGWVTLHLGILSTWKENNKRSFDLLSFVFYVSVLVCLLRHQTCPCSLRK